MHFLFQGGVENLSGLDYLSDSIALLQWLSFQQEDVRVGGEPDVQV